MKAFMKKKALITGITGQDGSYLAELLLSKGYEVHGLIRRASTFNTHRIDHLYVDPHDPEAKLFLHYGDLSDGARLVTLLAEINPDEVYNLAAQSHVRVSFDEPEHTADTTGTGTIRLLEAVRMSGIKPRFYQASSSELYGATPPPQNEDTPFYPRSPYAAAKLYSYWITKNYREAYDMFAVNGILFNHESPRRGETFVTRKITRAVAAIKAGKQDHLYMGNLDCDARLGLRRRVRRGHVAHAAGRRARRLRARDRRRHHRARVPRDLVQPRRPRLGGARQVRRALPAPDRGRRADRRPVARPHDKLGWKATIDGRELAKLMVDADIEALEHAGTPWIDTVSLESWGTK